MSNKQIEALKLALENSHKSMLMPGWTLVRNEDFAAIREALAEQPAPYPEGDVVGPCVCGSWPGGKCLKCPRIEQPAQPSKPWVGLTDEDVYPLANAHLRYQPESYEASGIYDLSRAIEAKLREKNNG